MVRANLVLVVTTLFLCNLGIAWAACSGSTRIECSTKGQCIRLQQVCNGVNDCTDNSDENPELCENWTFDQGNCSNSRVFCDGNCYNYVRFCNKKECASKVGQKACQMVKEKKFNIANSSLPAGLEIMSMTSTIEDINPSEEKENIEETEDKTGEIPLVNHCPSLYRRVGSRCLAVFTPAKIPWPEAREFCKSINGDLVHFDDETHFADLLRFLRNASLTTDFWIGGKYDSESSSWSWVKDESPMPLGSPFWAERYVSTCKRRPPPQLDPFSDPPAAIRGAPCYNYKQAPDNRELGWCSAMTYEHHYYITDEECHSTRSPLCVLVRRPRDSLYLHALNGPHSRYDLSHGSGSGRVNGS